MGETTTSVAAISTETEEYVAVPADQVDPGDRQRFRPIDATATRLGAGDARDNRMLLAIVAASAAIVAAFLAGYLVGDRATTTDVPVAPVASVVGSAPGGDAGMFAAGGRNDAGADRPQDPRRG